MPIFVSHAVPDGPWAQWIARELRAAGHTVHVDPVDADFAQRIPTALSGSDPVIVLFSAEHPGTDADWARALEPPTPTERLIVLGLDGVIPPPRLCVATFRTLHGLEEEDALDLLLSLVGGPRTHPNGWTTGR
ncbi:toll/interleukin-1 receptor domain-containing protein [Actinoplanes sp. NPDC051861]|uniref:toll/interleukin-1 receptor domain-containing protein n=1 Tax=Actinoplanes sp. NPDC051861 TaxID=3155170 RepID=UPI00342B42DC